MICMLLSLFTIFSTCLFTTLQKKRLQWIHYIVLTCVGQHILNMVQMSIKYTVCYQLCIHVTTVKCKFVLCNPSICIIRFIIGLKIKSKNLRLFCKLQQTMCTTDFMLLTLLEEKKKCYYSQLFICS